MIGLEQELVGTAFAIARDAIFGIVGRPETQNGNRRRASMRPRIVAAYDYTDEGEHLLHQTVRMEPKDFKQRRPYGSNEWIWNIKGVRLVLYRLPKLLSGKADTVYICEGEKDVLALEGLGLLATCNPMGAGKWRDEYAETLRGRRVVVITDNDPPTDDNGNPHHRGQQHAATVAESLLRHDCEVRIIEPPRGKDASDWLAQGGTLEEIDALVHEQAPLTSEALGAWTKRWLGPPAGATANVIAAEWSPPLSLQSELPAVQPFCEDLLPTSFRSLVRDVSERMQVPMDYPAVVLLLCLAGIVSRRAIIQPKANDTGWIVVPNLWGGIIAPPGFMKSPVIEAATRPLKQIQNKWRGDHDEALRCHADAKEEFELRHSAWKELYKASSKSGKPTPEKPTDKPIEPILRRLIVNDATFEALHQTMSENPAGILVIRDELTGWWSTLDRTGREGERAFCLQAWNGDTGHTIDRIGRGTVHVDACCMSMLGGIQPGRLRSYLADALRDGPSNDGLIQRFQVMVWPDTGLKWKYVDRPPDAATEERVTRIFQSLVELDPENPLRFRFDADAQQLFIEWMTDLEAKLRGSELHPALVSHLSKYRKLMPALALLFELADRVAAGAELLKCSDLLVSLEHAKQAAAFCDYLESHARRIYSCVTTPQMRAAQELAEKIKTRKVGADGFFSCRDVYLKGWSGLDSPEAVRLAIQVLEDACWIRQLSADVGPTGGRPSLRYQVNPKVWE
jgi:putative DNA primase/helicase